MIYRKTIHLYDILNDTNNHTISICAITIIMVVESLELSAGLRYVPRTHTHTDTYTDRMKQITRL